MSNLPVLFSSRYQLVNKIKTLQDHKPYHTIARSKELLLMQAFRAVLSSLMLFHLHKINSNKDLVLRNQQSGFLVTYSDNCSCNKIEKLKIKLSIPV